MDTDETTSDKLTFDTIKKLLLKNDNWIIAIAALGTIALFVIIRSKSANTSTVNTNVKPSYANAPLTTANDPTGYAGAMYASTGDTNHYGVPIGANGLPYNPGYVSYNIPTANTPITTKG